MWEEKDKTLAFKAIWHSSYGTIRTEPGKLKRLPTDSLFCKVSHVTLRSIIITKYKKHNKNSGKKWKD